MTFLDVTAKAKATKEKISKLYFIKLHQIFGKHLITLLRK